MIKQEFLRFLIIGVATTGVTYGLYLLLNLLLPYKVAYTLAYIAGIVFSYWVNTRWVFRTAMSLKSFLAFPAVYVVQYLIGIVFLHVIVERLNMSEQLAPLLVIVMCIPITFLLSRFIIKSRKQA